MSGLRDGPCSHAEAQELLPWGVTGRLQVDEASRFEAHVAACLQCQADVAAERSIRDAIRRSPRIEHAPQSSLQKLLSRIESSGPEVPTRAESDQSSRAVQGVDHGLGKWRVAATAVLGVAVGFVSGVLWRAQPVVAPAVYTTASQPGGVIPARTQLRVVFSPAMTIDDLTRVMRESRLVIVDGPTESGVYELASEEGGDAAARAALERLRVDPRVRFAEPVTTPAAEVP